QSRHASRLREQTSEQANWCSIQSSAADPPRRRPSPKEARQRSVLLRVATSLRLTSIRQLGIAVTPDEPHPTAAARAAAVASGAKSTVRGQLDGKGSTK